jgi:3',5'-cyclic AMP phosphodiesterase CpdA
MLIAQLTDTHISTPESMVETRYQTSHYLARAIRHLNRLRPRPELVLVTGDLTETGRPEEYACLGTLLAELEPPVYLIPGNHDQREALRAAFGPHRYLPTSGFLHYTIEHLPVRLLGLDTVVPGQVGGALCPERLDWLSRRLAEDQARPTVIFMHHPPFASGIAPMDKDGFGNAQALADLLKRFGHIERVVCGHVHRAISVRWAGTVGSIAPATAHQVGLDLSQSETPVEFRMEPPACQLLYWHDGAVIGHLSPIGEFPPSV